MLGFQRPPKWILTPPCSLQYERNPPPPRVLGTGVGSSFYKQLKLKTFTFQSLNKPKIKLASCSFTFNILKQKNIQHREIRNKAAMLVFYMNDCASYVFIPFTVNSYFCVSPEDHDYGETSIRGHFLTLSWF